MKQTVLIGCGLVCSLGAWLWLRSAAIEAPIAPYPSGRNFALAAPLSSDGNADPRIHYPPGHYPHLRLGNGATHQVHSLLNISRRLAFGDYVWDAKGVSTGPVWVRIDLANQLLSVFRGGDEIGTALIIYGTKAKPTPVGIYRVLEKSADYYSKSYDAPMPYALRLTADGVAIHASSVREHFATHGCIGVPLEFARLLYNEISRGDEVEILPANANG